MEEETPFWIQSSATRRRNRRLSSGVLLFTLSITLSLFLIPLLLSLSPQISRPNLFKKSWDSLNITLVLLALIFAFLTRNRNRDHLDFHAKIESQPQMPNEPVVVRSGWHEYPDPTADVALTRNPTVESDNPTDSNIRNVVTNSGWYEYSDRTAVIGLKRSHSSYPDLREIYPNDSWRFHDDTSLDAYPRSGNSSPEEEMKKSSNTAKGEVSSVNTGTVLGVGEGIARVRGLDGVTAGEIVEFDEGIIGIVTNSECTESVGVLLMGDGLRIPEGSCVKATGKIAQVPASLGQAGLARGADFSAKPIDGGDEIKEMPPAVRRRTRRTAGSDGNKGKLSEEVSGMETPSGKLSHRRTKSSGLEPSGEKLSHRKTKSNGFERFGTVLLVGKGIARIYGLDEVTKGEIVEFEEGTIGIVMNSESVNNVGVVLMGDGLLIQEGSRVKATGKIAQIPVPEAHLGSVINSLAKPIGNKGEIPASECRLVEESEIKQLPPAVRRRTRRTDGSFAKKGKPCEEVNGLEQVSRRKTKRTHEESIIPKVEVKDELELNEYESSPEILVQDAQSSPPARSERKSATRDFLTSLTKKKKKQKQKGVENLDISPESPPPSPPHPSRSFFSSKKGKSKKFVTVPPPPPPPPPYFTVAHEQKSAPPPAPAATRRPPLAAKTHGFVEERERESAFSGAESPLHPIPSPPPPPPFKMPSWKFVVKGDYVKIGSVNSSRSVSPEPDEVDSPMSSESGGGDVAMGTMFCPSPDVNSKADMFIAKFRAGLKLQKMNSMKQKQGVGLSNLGPVSTLDQAQA